MTHTSRDDAYPERMTKRLVLAALPLALLAACGGSSSDADKGSTTSSSSTSVQRAATYKNAAAVKDALVASGAQSCDEWKPLDTPSDTAFETEGSCGSDVRVVTFKTDDFSKSEAVAKIADQEMRKELADPQFGQDKDVQYVKGPELGCPGAQPDQVGTRHPVPGRRERWR